MLQIHATYYSEVRALNVLFLSELFFPHGGGAELATYEYAKLLSDKGINVTVVTNRFSSEPNLSKTRNIAIYRLPLFKGSSVTKFKTLFNPRMFSSFYKKLFTWADLVYVPRFWFSAIPLAKAYGKPVLVHLHDYILVCPLAGMYDFHTNRFCQSSLCSQRCIYSFEQRFGRSLKSSIASTVLNSTLGLQFRRLIALSDGIVCVSNAQKSIIVKKLPSLRNKIRVIYNPLPECSPMEIQGADYGFLGGLNPIKGFSVLHCALKEFVPNLHITLHATNFPSRFNTPELLNNSIIFFYGKLSSVPLNEMYNKIRAIIFPSIGPEPSPYVLSETILKGRFVIASDIGGLRELGNDCKGVFFFEPGNAKNLAEQIDYTSNLSNDVVTDFVAQSREVFLKKFSREATINSFYNLCNELIEKKVHEL